MKRPGIVGAVAVAAIAAVAFPRARDELYWLWVTAADSPDGYESYVSARPDGRHAGEARQLAEERTWQAVVAANTAAAFLSYLDKYPAGRYAEAGHQKVEESTWNEAKSRNTVKSVQIYLTRYPRGRFSREAAANVAALRKDENMFVRAQQQGTEQAWEAFLEDFPGHVRTEAARRILRDIRGRDIVDLIQEGKIEVRAQGSGIETVSLRVRRLVPDPVLVRIPVGTFFVSGNQSAQNMVATEATVQRLETIEWVGLSVAAACANRPRDIPGEDDSFRIQRSPKQAELERLMPALEKANVPYPVRQAAVWIVTDDADYEDLGILVSRSVTGPFGGARTIQEAEAAQAMKIYSEAGMDITRKAIWRDRDEILRGLEDRELKRWLHQRR